MAGKAEDFLDSAEGFLDAPDMQPAPTKADDFLESGRERDPAYLHYPKALGRGAMQTMGGVGAYIERKGVEKLAGPAPIQTPSRDVQEAAADTDFASGENPFTAAMESVAERTGKPVDQMVEESDVAQTRAARKAWDDKIAKETPEAKQRRVTIGKSLAGYGRSFSDKAQEYADDYFPADQQTQSKPFDERLSDDTTRAVLTAIVENAPNTAMSLGAAKIMGKLGKTGAYTGAAGSSYVLESGDIFQTGVKFLEQKYGGFENVPDHEFGRLIEVSQAHGLFNAGLDALMPGNIASAAARRQLADSAIQKILSGKSAKEIGGSTIKNAFLELAPELVQEDSSIVGESRIGIEHTPRDIANRKLQAGIAGGGIGGITGAASGVSDIRARNAEVGTAGGESPKAEDFLDNVEDVLSGEARPAKPLGLPSPDTASKSILGEVSPVIEVTPEGVAGTESQIDAERRAQAQRAQELGTDEVEGAVQGRAPLPETEPTIDESAREPDDLIKVISRAGGLSRGEAKSQGIDPVVFTDQRSRQVFGRPLFPKQGGMTMDGLAEFLSQRGFLPEGQYSANEALDLVDRALRGEKIYSTYNAADAFEKQAAEREADMREQSGGQAGPVGLNYRADDLRSRITAVQKNRVKSVLGDDAARLWEPKPDDFALSGYIKESPDVQDLAASMYEGRRIMGDNAFEAFFERFSTQNADLDGDAFESKLTSAIRSHGNAQKPGDAEENRPGAGRVEETAQPRVSQERENHQTSPPDQAGQEVTPPAGADRSARQDRPETRRQDAEQRKSVAQMSPDELRRELLTDALTGLPNRRAYDDSTKKPVQVAIDLDSLKWINDSMGHESGDKALAALGQALRESGLEAYHISGDEFMVQGEDRAAIESGMTSIRSRLDNAVIHFEHPDGSTTTKTGVHFSYGIGATRNEADTALSTDKANREASGRRAARGQAPGGVERRAKAQPDNQDRSAANQEVTPPEQPPDSRTPRAGTEPPSKEGVSFSATEKTEAKPDPSPQADMFAPMVEAAKAMTEAANALKSAVEKNPEARTTSPVAESQAPATPEPGERSVASTQEGGAPGPVADETAKSGEVSSTSPVDAAAHEAATSPQNDIPQPTEAQKDAGNYAKGHVTIGGLDIAIENPEGSKRRPEWPTLKSHYGYFKRSEGKDGDQVDVFVKPGTTEDYSGPVFVVDQTNKDGKFDEHKVLIGWNDGAAARAGYLENYTPGWTGLGAMRKFSLGEFKLWLKSGNTKKPVALQGKKLASKSAAAGTAVAPSKKSEANTEDSGSELTANKRNRLARLSWDDIKDKDAALRVRETTKNKVYPRPDYQSMVDNGMEPLIAHIVKQAYDALASKPNTRTAPTDAQLEAYIDGVNRYMDGVMAWANDNNKVVAFIRKIAGKAKVLQGVSSGVPTTLSSLSEIAEKSLLETVYPDGWRNSIDAVRIIGGNKTLAALQPSTNEAVRAMNEIGKGWPSSQEAWQRQGYRVVNGDDIKSSVYVGTRTDGTKYAAISYKIDGRTISVEYVEGAERESDKAVQDEIKAGTDETKGKYLLLNKNNKAVGAFESEDGARDKARELTAKGGKKTISDKGISVEMAERTGPARRMEGEDISSDKLRETFGFKGVNFGNWMKGKSNEAERQLHLNHTYDSFLDLAEILGVPPKAMSLNGMLGLAIGAQGTGKFAAHFVPGVNEINLTRTSGAGSLAHEFAHAVDHYFARLAGLERKTDPWLTSNVGLSEKSLSAELRQEVLSGFKAIVKSMNSKPETEAERKIRHDASIKRAEKNVSGWLDSIRRDFIREKVDEKAFDALADKVRNLDLGDGMVMVSSKTALHKTISELRDLYAAAAKRPYSLDRIVGMQNNVDHLKYLKSEKAQSSEHIPQTQTDYSRDAAKLDKDKGGKPYWNTPWEKFARAFDAYVSDKLEAKAAKNTYLSHAGRDGETVPKGEERKTINAAFDNLVSELKTKETDQGTALFSRKPEDATSANVNGISFHNGIDENLKEKAAALEEAGQSAGTFRITAGKLLDAVLDGNLSKEAREELQPVKILQDLFGAPVALVSSEGKFQFNGVYYQGTIWISADSSISLPLVFGHELSHRMEADNPAAYNALLSAVRPMLRNLERYEALNSLEGYSDKYIQKEMLGDLLGDSFGDKSFWQQVAAHTSRQDFNKIITAIRMWIDRVIAKLRGLGSEKFVSDLEAARKIMAKAVANYADARKAGEQQDGPRFSRDTTPATDDSAKAERDKMHAGILDAYRAKARKVVDRIDKALDPLGSLPESRAYLAKRYRTLGVIANADAIAKSIGKAFGTATPEDRIAVYDYLTTRDAAPTGIRNELVRAEAAKVKRMIESVGDAMVARGILSEDAREAHRGSYLPQLYLKWMLNESDVKLLGAGKKPGPMSYLKGRKIERIKGPDGEPRFVWRESGEPLTDEQTLDLGPISDPGFLAATAIATPIRDMALLDFLSHISQNEKWVLPNSLIEFDGTHTTPQWLKDEADRLRRQADHYGPEEAKKARDIADRMDTAANKALKEFGLNTKDLKRYRQIPNTHKYGRLRGLWVRKEIYDDLVGVYDLSPADPGFVQSLLGYGGIGTKVTQLWKMGKVSLNPPAQVRNFVSNMVLLQLSGVPLHKIPGYIKKAVGEIANNGDHWKIAKKYGVTESTFATQELYRIRRDLLDLEMREGRLHTLGKIHRAGAIIADTASDAYQFMEALGKTIKIMHGMESGLSEAEAAIEAQRWLFDYSLVPKSVRYIRNAPVGMPFLCVSDDTEALTSEGWKGIDDIKDGDLVASFDMESEKLAWKPVLSVYRAPYNGDMVHVKNKSLDILMTPDHRCVTYRRRKGGASLEIVGAKDLNSRDSIPCAAPFEHEPVGDHLSDDVVKLCGWIISEGTFHPSGGIIIGQNEGVKEREIRELLHLVVPGGFSERSMRFENGNAIHHRFHIKSAGAKRFRELLPDKHLTPSLLMRLSTEQIELIVRAILDGDGHIMKNGTTALTQNPGPTADAFQMALMMIGRASVARKKPPYKCLTITMKRSARAHLRGTTTKETESYDGRIWCPEVPGFTTWVARRNGKTFITGNTFQYKVLPRLAEVALLHPQRLIPWVTLFAGWPLLWAALAGEDDDEYERLQKAMPKWLQERGHAMILPHKDDEGRWQVVDLGYFMPWSMYTDLLGDMSRGELGEAAQTAGLFSGPVTNVIVAMKTGKDSFTGRDIMDPGDPPGRQFVSALNYTYDMMMPPIISSRGLASPIGLLDAEYGGKIVQAATGRTNKYGDPTATATQTALYPIGINLYSLEPQHSTAQNVLRLKYEADQTELALKRKLQNRGLNDEARREIVQEYTDEIIRRNEKINEYLDR